MKVGTVFDGSGVVKVLDFLDVCTLVDNQLTVVYETRHTLLTLVGFIASVYACGKPVESSTTHLPQCSHLWGFSVPFCFS